MSMAANMNRYDTCISCGGAVLNGLPCACRGHGPLRSLPPGIEVSPPPGIEVSPPPEQDFTPVPRNREMAKVMIALGEKYLRENPEV